MSEPVEKFHETKERFSWHWVGKEIHSDENLREEKTGEYWDVVVNVTESAGLFNDSLAINGIATHKLGPHDEGVNPDSFIFNFVVNAENCTPGTNGFVNNAVLSHDGHKDLFQSILTVNVDSWGAPAAGGPFDDIDGWTLVLKGVHVVGTPREERPPPPKPRPKPSDEGPVTASRGRAVTRRGAATKRGGKSRRKG